MQKSTVKYWLETGPLKFRRQKASYLHRFLQWRASKGLESNPDNIIAEVKDGTMKVLNAHLDVLLTWAEGRQDPSLAWCEPATLGQYYNTVRGFYAGNRCRLPVSGLKPRKNGGPAEVPTQPSAQEYLDMTKRVLESGRLTVRDRSIVLTKLQGFMDNETLASIFNFVAFPQLAKHFGTDDFRLWDSSKVPVIIHLVRHKTGYLHYTFLDRDAIEAMKAWLEVREGYFGPVKTRPPRPKMLARSDPIYCVRYQDEMRPLQASYVTRLFRNAGERAGVNIPPPKGDVPAGKEAKRRYPFSAHEVRDTAITFARTAGVPTEVVNFFAGHNIDALGYDKSPRNDPEHFRAMYSRLARFLNPVTGATLKIKAEYERRLEDQIRSRDREIEDLKLRATHFEELLNDRLALVEQKILEADKRAAALGEAKVAPASRE